MYKKVVYTYESLVNAFKEIRPLINPDIGYILTFQELHEQRRNTQNSKYWHVIHEIAEQLHINGKLMSPESWHEWSKRKFIGVREIRLPNGEVLLLGKSSTNLSVNEFADYIQELEAWAVEHGVVINERQTC